MYNKTKPTSNYGQVKGILERGKGEQLGNNFFNHGGHIGHIKVHPLNYFCIFYSFELQACSMVELCFAKNPTFFVFRF